jgi:hypothetical protein
MHLLAKQGLKSYGSQGTFAGADLCANALISPLGSSAALGKEGTDGKFYEASARSRNNPECCETNSSEKSRWRRGGLIGRA